MSGTLYVVATPIGNLEDVTLRSLRILKEVNAIASEDTRTTRKLLDRHGIATPVVAYFQHSGPGKRAALIERLKAGDSLALVSESGTPAISDPGADLVADAHEAGIPVRTIPGPSSVASAVAASGFPAERFVFEGFLPRKPGKVRKILEGLSMNPRTLVFFESPYRVKKTLTAMHAAWGDRRIAIARELTKVYEEIRRTTLVRAIEDAKEPRGEYVIVVEGRELPKKKRSTEEE